MNSQTEKVGYTPGPWEVANTYIGCIAILEYSPSRVLTVSPCGGMATALERQFNARLIAAAPDLLEALTRLLDDLDVIQKRPCVSIDLAQAAIKKATEGK